jgi:ATP-dependent RNA helicase DeaD
MEVLNNVQLEGRRINVEISKMMVAEDVIITEEVLVEVLVVESSAQEREGSFAQEEKVQVVDRSDRNSAPREGGFGQEKSSAPREGGFHLTDLELVLLTEHQDVLKALALDQEDQEETNIYC